jgi:hypothetical protein
VIQEAYVHGISTRAVDDLVKAMGGSGVSKSQVSRLCEEIDEQVNALSASRMCGGISHGSLGCQSRGCLSGAADCERPKRGDQLISGQQVPCRPRQVLPLRN